MSQSFDPVFGSWYTEKQLGSGTDGKAFTIIRYDETGKKERAVLKTIRVGDYRNEKKSFNTISGVPQQPSREQRIHQKIIRNITENIDIICQADGGKHFVKYEEWEKRETSDGKGTLILIRLEEMRSLSDLLEQFSLTREETLRLGISVCRSLIRCRDFGYIYPNLKPENILFDRKGVCKLGDFGSFSCLEPAKTSIAYKRTQYFAAPEYIKSGKINCTCDTYSLGLVLYCLINRGRLPFTEAFPQELTIGSFDRSKQSRMEALPFPQPALYDEAICRIIGKSCAFRPEDRYLSPKQMLQDLQSALMNEPFGHVEYEDVYSDPAPEAEAVSQPVQPAEPAPVQPVNLYEEITIPADAPSALPQEGPHTEKKTPDLTEEIETPARRPQRNAPKPKKPPMKRLLILAIAAIVVLILLIVSIAIRFSGREEPTVAAAEAVAVISVLQGGAFYGL